MKKKIQTTVIVIIVISVLAVSSVLIWGFTSNWGQGKSLQNVSLSQEKVEETQEKVEETQEKVEETQAKDNTELTDEQYCKKNKDKQSINAWSGNTQVTDDMKGCAGSVYASGSSSDEYCNGSHSVFDKNYDDDPEKKKIMKEYQKFYTTCCTFNKDKDQCESKYDF